MSDTVALDDDDGGDDDHYKEQFNSLFWVDPTHTMLVL